MINPYVYPGLVSKPDLHALLSICCDVCGVTMDEVKGLLKKSELVLARQVFCYYAHGMEYTFSEIGEFINRDHSTAIYTINRIRSLRDIQDRRVIHCILSVGNSLSKRW